jgi:hypothetical protein
VYGTLCRHTNQFQKGTAGLSGGYSQPYGNWPRRAWLPVVASARDGTTVVVQQILYIRRATVTGINSGITYDDHTGVV